MKSPFPGMDPYLEDHWRDVHARLNVYMCDQLQAQLPDDLMARVEEGVTVDEGGSTRTIFPDARVVEEEESAGLPFETGPASVAVAEPLLIKKEQEPATDRHIEILDSYGRLVTAIEVISPTNKADFDSRFVYRRKQKMYLNSGVNLVEIDLIRRGEHVLALGLDNLDKPLPPYLICLRRASRPATSEVYGASLRERLPVIPIPLRPKERDVALDLQALIDTCYERGRYNKIDYTRPLKPPLDPADAEWAEKLLREKQGRLHG